MSATTHRHTNAKACHVVQQQVLNRDTMESMFDGRFPTHQGSALQKAWRDLYGQLLSSSTTTREELDCDEDAHMPTGSVDNRKSLLSTVSETIVKSFQCPQLRRQYPLGGSRPAMANKPNPQILS
uniref:Uncharacterized protein n=1 Tax=Entomoneis paludosa TaxID=265537 RepID=A0A7S2VD68_9STRA|mmetsp:Transcript_15296/g.31566  ORF Transcript_15296/g.31566 Transcript_15296/m.31566 type:complete len:125 (+) Transcript_15296:3-377(+)